MTASESYIVAALLAIITAVIWLPSLWQQGNRRLEALLADADADLDAQMVAACRREADRELLVMSATPEFDRLSVEFFNAALSDDTKGRWTA